MKRRRVLLGGLAALAATLAPASWAVLRHPRFGREPAGGRLERLKQSPHYGNGRFHNLIPTPRFAPGVNMASVLRDFYLKKHERLVPQDPLPTIKSNLKAPPPEDVAVWFGHSSWLIQVNGRRVLIDPVFSDHAAPFSFLTRAFPGTSVFTPADLPGLDAVLVSHNHWDHLDYATVMALKNRVPRIVCPLGLGAYFAAWGFPEEQVRELDWNEKVALPGLEIHALPARHYSRRLWAEDATFWCGFALTTPSRRVFYSGDSGYGPHFAEIGRRFGGFDLTLMECGQYDPSWPFIHMAPEESAKAAADLGARLVLPSHLGRFTIANHAWDDPYIRLTKACENAAFRLMTPKIGEVVRLDAPGQGEAWWRGRE